jgi:pyruvate dehydrogenase E2 component (dihydrolipoamide acetyltransferase)
LFTLDGDKALQEIEATDSGVLQIPAGAPSAGTVVRVGTLLGYLLAKSGTDTPRAGNLTEPVSRRLATVKENPSSPATAGVKALATTSGPPATVTRRTITPRALNAAVQLKVDWTKLQGSGRGGRIRERDVIAVTEKLNR